MGRRSSTIAATARIHRSFMVPVAAASPRQFAAITSKNRCGRTSKLPAQSRTGTGAASRPVGIGREGFRSDRKQVTRLEGLLAQKETERSRVVGLYRRGRLTDAELDTQMDEIGKEESALETQIAELRSKMAGADSIGATISSAQALLEKLGNGWTSRSRGN